jgi:hypothetical protein
MDGPELIEEINKATRAHVTGKYTRGGPLWREAWDTTVAIRWTMCDDEVKAAYRDSAAVCVPLDGATQLVMSHTDCCVLRLLNSDVVTPGMLVRVQMFATALIGGVNAVAVSAPITTRLTGAYGPPCTVIVARHLTSVPWVYHYSAIWCIHGKTVGMISNAGISAARMGCGELHDVVNAFMEDLAG